MSFDENILVKSLGHRLGGVKIARTQLKFKICPNCDNDNWNFEISSEKLVGHCWICDFGCTVNKVFKMLDIPFADDGMKVSPAPKIAEDELTLRPFRSIQWANYSKFLKSRGLEKSDIKKYNILTTDKGKFKNKIIFPLYEGDKLVYLVARELTPKGRYFNINVSRSGVLPFYPGVRKQTEAYLCEGVIDAISVNKLGYVSMVLLGTVLSAAQMRKITARGYKSIVISLDGDVVAKAIKIYDKISDTGMRVKLASFGKKDDPNSLFIKDKAELMHALKNSREVTLTDRIRLKLK